MTLIALCLILDKIFSNIKNTLIMSNKKVVLGVAAGVAALAVVGLLLVKKKKSKKAQLSEKAQDAKDNFKSKLNEWQRKAKKEFNSTLEEGENVANKAKDRANEWISKTTS